MPDRFHLGSMNRDRDRDRDTESFLAFLRPYFLLLVLIFLTKNIALAQVPSCDCETLGYLCYIFANPSSCAEYQDHCTYSSYCGCMMQVNNTQWCQQFGPQQFCSWCSI